MNADLRDGLRAIKIMHSGKAQRVGPKLLVEVRCKECGKPAPCPSWSTANDALLAAQG